MTNEKQKSIAVEYFGVPYSPIEKDRIMSEYSVIVPNLRSSISGQLTVKNRIFIRKVNQFRYEVFNESEENNHVDTQLTQRDAFRSAYKMVNDLGKRASTEMNLPIINKIPSDKRFD